MHAFYRRHRRRFERRRREGCIRDGHGDLRSDHIYFTLRGIRIINCIEFDRSLRVLDVIDDLTFLVMDLVHSGFGAQAKALIQGYLRRSDDLGALFLIDFYACHRAMVRCKVSICQRARPRRHRE